MNSMTHKQTQVDMQICPANIQLFISSLCAISYDTMTEKQNNFTLDSKYVFSDKLCLCKELDSRFYVTVGFTSDS